jgi:hypothetical protein
MFGKYNGFVSKARVSACLYFLVGKEIENKCRSAKTSEAIIYFIDLL